MHIIHYTTLDDLLTDAPIGATVYVSQQISVRFDQDQNNIAYRVTTAQAFARIPDDGAVLSYTPYIQKVTTMEAIDPAKDRIPHDLITQEATDVAASLFNASRLAGYRTRTAIVDLHGVKPIKGQTWQFSEEDQKEEAAPPTS
ncbi:MAG: hypothetical protein H6641_16090 [Caldilineaceae bacterium]|nr:hypothetical protein [Caldilineaceae bacterium]